MARMHLTDDDEGKRVVNFDGTEIGMVTAVKGEQAHVDPDPGLTDKIRSRLGWSDSSTDDYVLEQDRIDTITEDEIRLQK